MGDMNSADLSLQLLYWVFGKSHYRLEVWFLPPFRLPRKSATKATPIRILQRLVDSLIALDEAFLLY